MELYNKSTADLFDETDSNKNGLSPAESAKRLGSHGYNEIAGRDKTPLWKLILDSLKDPMVIILALVVLIKPFLDGWVEAAVIFLVILLNSLISVVQTKKAEGSLAALREISAPMAKVRRDGDVSLIPGRELVPGDVVILEAGDFVPADGRVITSGMLRVDEGILTGESLPVEKTDKPLDGILSIGDRINTVHSGTFTVHGRGECLITATGKKTEIGKIATLIETAQERQTPLQRRLEQFSRKLGLVILGICVLIFIMEAGRVFFDDAADLQSGIFNAFMFAVAVAVAAIPEALSSVVTIVLSAGTKKMAGRHAIIRKLPAVEALGSTSVICTDKTGTLTQNKMAVVDYVAPQGETPATSLLLHAMLLCNDAVIKDDGTQIGDPTETALLHFGEKQGTSFENLRREHPRISALPFDSQRKLMSTLHEINGKRWMLVKGAPDVLFTRCHGVLTKNVGREFEEGERETFRLANESMSTKELRVLAYAAKEIPPGQDMLTQKDEQDLYLIGLTAMIDPPRKEVYGAIESAKSAHIRTVMITGDHKTTAFAIAKDIGIIEEGDIAVTGTELDEMSEETLDKQLEHISVYARVSPENKIRIVRAWQKKGQITAMTGDGVNDAPSLKQADIGIAMGSGTEVAKDASAMILTDDNFVSIIGAVSVGRTIFDNIKKVVGYLFSGNLGGIVAILFALLANWTTPFTALQLLFINMVNDSIPAIALGLEKEEPDVMARPPRDMNEGIFSGGLFGSVLMRGFLIGIATIVSQYVGTQMFSHAIGTTMAFTTLILARTLQTFSSRSTRQSMFKMGIFKNRWATLAVIICSALYAAVLLPGVREIFHIAPDFGLRQFSIALGIAAGAIFLMECTKLVKGTLTKDRLKCVNTAM